MEGKLARGQRTGRAMLQRSSSFSGSSASGVGEEGGWNLLQEKLRQEKAKGSVRGVFRKILQGRKQREEHSAEQSLQFTKENTLTIGAPMLPLRNFLSNVKGSQHKDNSYNQGADFAILKAYPKGIHDSVQEFLDSTYPHDDTYMEPVSETYARLCSTTLPPAPCATPSPPPKVAPCPPARPPPYCLACKSAQKCRCVTSL